MYKRDRLARDFYEYVEIVQVFYQYGVEVVFTSPGEIPFSRHLYMEAFLAMFAELEGKNIWMRSADSNQRNPVNILGYRRIKDAGGIRYEVDENKAVKIRQLFHDFSIPCFQEEFFERLLHYSKVFKGYDSVLSILQKPFYCGYWKSNGEFHELQHVTPIISLETYIKANKNLESYAEPFLKTVQQAKSQVLLVPKCGFCGGDMKVYQRDATQAGHFVCAKSHKSIKIDVLEFNELLQEHLFQYAQKVVANEFQRAFSKFYRKQFQKWEKDVARLALEFKEQVLKITVSGHVITTKQRHALLVKFPNVLISFWSKNRSFKHLTWRIITSYRGI